MAKTDMALLIGKRPERESQETQQRGTQSRAVEIRKGVPKEVERLSSVARRALPKTYRRIRQAILSHRRRCSFRLETKRLEPSLRQAYRDKYESGGSFRRGALHAEHYENESIREDHVLYESYHGTVFGGNPYAIFIYLIDEPGYEHLHHVITVKDVNHPIAARFKDHPRVRVVETDSDEYIRYCQSCKYLVNDTSFRPQFIKRPEQVYIYTWHSTLLKRLAAHTERPWEARNIGKSLTVCDYLTSPNRFTSDILLSAYYADILFDGQITEFGYPRNDLIFHTDKNHIRQLLGIPAGKKIVLYAPTWRGSLGGVRDSVHEFLRYRDEIQAKVGDDHVVLAKLHTMVYQHLSEDDLAKVAPLSVDTNELLAVTDVLISDYSGIMFDFLITGNPIVCFAFDRDEYVRNQGEFYFPLEELPAPICQTTDQVADAINDLDAVRQTYAERYRTSAARFVYADRGDSCKKLARLVFKGVSSGGNEVYRLPRSDKKRILMYASTMAGNGVTESFLTLLDHIDYSRYDVTIVIPNSVRHIARHVGINKNARLYYMNCSLGTTEDEWVALGAFRALGLDVSDDVRLLRRCMERNLRRLFGGTSFDIVVNYAGYSETWALLLALGIDADRKVIYMHNDLNKDRETKHPFLHATFSTYRFYDSVIAVSKGSMKVNRRDVGAHVSREFGFSLRGKMGQVMNLVDGEEVLARARDYAAAAHEGRRYVRVPGTGAPNLIKLIAEPRSENTNFVMVGRLSPEKRHDRLFKAFSRLAATRPNVRLYVLGDGVLRLELDALAKKMGIHDKVIFTGYVDNPYPFIDKCDCFVLPSDFEGQPIVILEALTLEKPVIASKIAGSRDLLEPNYGVLIKRRVAALHKAMLDFVENGMERKTFDHEAHNREALRLFYEKVCLEPAAAIRALNHDSQ